MPLVEGLKNEVVCKNDEIRELFPIRLFSTDEAIHTSLSEMVQGSKSLVSGLLDGEHLFVLETIGEAQVRFVQKKTYSGILLPIMWPWLKGQGFEAFGMMNRALKKAAEHSCESSF
jgi:hypothetical protein